MPAYEIAPYGAFLSNYDIVNEEMEDDDENYEMIHDSWFRSGWGYHSTLTTTYSPKASIRVCEKWWGWTPTFHLLDHNNDHYATFKGHAGDCCSSNYFEVTSMEKVDDDSSGEHSFSDDDADDEDDRHIWFTIEEDINDNWLEPCFIFRRIGTKCGTPRAKRVAYLSTSFSPCSTGHRLRLSDNRTTDRENRTVLAVSLIIIRLQERKRK